MKAGVPRLAPFTPVTDPVAANASDMYIPLASTTVTVGVAGMIVKVAPVLVAL